MYLYVKLNWDANFFVSVENKDCKNSASYEYRNMSATERGTMCTHWNADYLFENLSPENHEYVVD